MSKQKKLIDPGKIHLFSIKVFKGLLETSEAFLEAPNEVEGFEFGIGREIAHNLEAGLTRLRLFFTLNGLNQEREALGLKAEYGIEFQFKVENFDDFVTQSEGKDPQIDASIGGTLIGIAYSTARGIILERLQGTFFGGIILPVIDPMTLLLEGDIKEKT